jgi:hypothetical protein
MRQLRILQQGVWYEIRTLINNREPLFRTFKALALFARVFHETNLRFVFKVCGLRLEEDRLTFYINNLALKGEVVVLQGMDFMRVHTQDNKFWIGLNALKLPRRKAGSWVCTRLRIKPEDGYELPDIMKWLKQTFAQRYNVKRGG